MQTIYFSLHFQLFHFGSFMMLDIIKLVFVICVFYVLVFEIVLSSGWVFSTSKMSRYAVISSIKPTYKLMQLDLQFNLKNDHKHVFGKSYVWLFFGWNYVRVWNQNNHFIKLVKPIKYVFFICIWGKKIIKSGIRE